MNIKNLKNLGWNLHTLFYITLTIVMLYIVITGANAKEVSPERMLQVLQADTMAVAELQTESKYTTVTYEQLHTFWQSWIKSTPDRSTWKCVMYSSRFWCDYQQANPNTACFMVHFKTWKTKEGHCCIMFYDGKTLHYFEPQSGLELHPSTALQDQLSLVKG